MAAMAHSALSMDQWGGNAGAAAQASATAVRTASNLSACRLYLAAAAQLPSTWRLDFGQLHGGKGGQMVQPVLQRKGAGWEHADGPDPGRPSSRQRNVVQAMLGPIGPMPSGRAAPERAGRVQPSLEQQLVEFGPPSALGLGAASANG